MGGVSAARPTSESRETDPAVASLVARARTKLDTAVGAFTLADALAEETDSAS